ncbi:MAG TPA: GNAT family N-acetyltransferase [Gemmatimonadaceae bacterium]|jgi:ribosomal protein S18 acetylase RimI-like enzyme
MPIDIRRENADALTVYASIPNAFEVREVIDLAALDLGVASLPVRAVTPRIKDYDALPHNDPASWLARRRIFDWVFLLANAEGRTIAGAVVITEESEVIALGGRPRNALLWDLRVAPAWRRRGLGRALLREAEVTAREAGAQALDVETQDTNVPPCRLYASCGFSLADVHIHGYRSLTDEAKLLWTKTLP